MQENEFEKKLQQKMEQLQVQPAGEVWQKIQLQVAKRNERKRRIVFFFLMFLLLTAIMLLTDTSKLFNHKEPVAATQQENRGKAEPADKTTIQPTAQQPNQEQLPAERAIAGNSTTGVVLEKDHSTTENTIVKSPLTRRKKRGALKTTVIMAVPTGETAAEDMTDVKQPGTIISKRPVASLSSGQNNGAGEEQPVAVAMPPAKNELITPDATTLVALQKAEPPAPNEAVINSAVKKDSADPENKEALAITKPAKKENKGKWNIALTVSAGRSSAVSSYLSQKSMADYLENAGNSAGSPGNTLYTPSSIRPGFAFTAGFKIVRNISARSRLAGGLQYELQTSLINTGERSNAYSDSLVMYRTGNTKTYTNHYHLISLPFSFSTAIFNAWKKEVSLELGVKLSKLINSNGLSFNPVQGIYYSDKSVFNKTILGLSGAALINLGSKGKMPFYIGPEFYYSITPQASAGMYAGLHYSYFGVRLQKNITK